MFTHILAYLLGIGTGAALLIANRRSIEVAVAAEKRRSQQSNDRLKQQNDVLRKERDKLLLEREWNSAYAEGRRSPLSDVEKFADTLESHGARFVDTSI